jgi:hypothetical protein
LTLALVIGFAGSAHELYAQTWKTGVTRTISDAYLSAADSVYSFGSIPLLKSNGTRVDSVSITVSTQDSLRFALVLTLKNAFGTVMDTASITQVGGDKIIDATAAGQVVFPYYTLRGAFGDKLAGAASITVGGIVYAVGSEVASSGKKFNIRSLTWE